MEIEWTIKWAAPQVDTRSTGLLFLMGKAWIFRKIFNIEAKQILQARNAYWLLVQVLTMLLMMEKLYTNKNTILRK